MSPDVNLTPGPPEEDAPAELLPVRAAVHLPGLSLGFPAEVDPRDEYIAGLLAAHLLVAVE